MGLAAELPVHAVFLAMTEKWTIIKAPMFEFLLTHRSWPMAWPYGQVDEQWKTGPLKGCLCGGLLYRIHSRNLRGALK